MLRFFTAGYHGHSIETFLDLLQSHGIGYVVDVRQLPFSHCKEQLPCLSPSKDSRSHATSFHASA